MDPGEATAREEIRELVARYNQWGDSGRLSELTGLFCDTATLEFARTRPESRYAHLVALTRVMASGYGFEAEGLELSRRVLGV